MKRTLRLATGLALLMAAVFAVSQPASARSTAPQKCQSAAQLKGMARRQAIESTIKSMEAAQRSESEISSTLANDFCLTARYKVLAGPAIPQTVASDISVYAPSFYQDTDGSWLVHSWWRWNSILAVAEDPSTFCNNPCAVGGADGFGISLNEASIIQSYNEDTGGHAYGYYAGSRPGRMSPASANSYGVTYMGVDHMSYNDSCALGAEPTCAPDWCKERWPNNTAGQNTCKSPDWCVSNGYPHISCLDYDFFFGDVFLYVNSFPCGKQIQAFAQYAHSWSNTSLTGFGVGPFAFSVQWSSASNNWTRASQPSTAVRAC